MWRLVHSSIKWESDRTWWLCVWITLCAFNGSMRCMFRWELRWVLDWSRSDSGVIIQYSAIEQGYLVLALFKHALLLLLFLLLYIYLDPVIFASRTVTELLRFTHVSICIYNLELLCATLRGAIFKYQKGLFVLWLRRSEAFASVIYMWGW